MALAAILVLKFLSNGDGAPPCEDRRRLTGTFENIRARVSDLLHVAEDVLPAVKDPSALLAVQLVDEVSGEVLVAVLVPERQTALKVKTSGSAVHLSRRRWAVRVSPEH